MHKSKGNAIPFEEAAERMGADVMRWMFCRNNPANNINFGYRPADEIRNRFIFKLWNTYAFFCNYARLDGFDSGAAAVPVHERPDIDRWILSDLQLLIQTAQREFEDYNVMAFCLAAEEFVAEKLSNWYVRRNRRRFWKSEKSTDKLAAYQTLYTVLTTLSKLLAPIMPFLTEVMYQNLEQSQAESARSARPLSVHLCDFPQVDKDRIDAKLSAEMEALLRLVSLGSAARNSVKIKVRQPLAEIRIQAASDPERDAVIRFGEQIADELNVKKVSLHDSEQGPLLQYEVKPNLKALGPKLGQQLKDVQRAVAQLEPAAIIEKFQRGEGLEVVHASGVTLLDSNDLLVTVKAPEGWAGVADRNTQLMLDVRITEELEREGTAREIVRHVQELRKKAGLEMEDRIRLHFHTDSSAIRQAIESHESYICGETLATELTSQPLDGGASRAVIKLLGGPLTIELDKASFRTTAEES